MTENPAQPPFGISAALPAFARATRLAKALFGGVDASIVLSGPSGLWRSYDACALPRIDPAETIMASGEGIWIADALTDARCADTAWPEEQTNPRCYVGAPIRLADGSTLGVIFVVSRDPRSYQEALAGSLVDLADFVADECDRAIAADASAKATAALETKCSELAAFADTTPVSIVMTDREMRIVKASGLWMQNRRLTEAEVLGRSIYDIVSGYQRFEDAYDQVLAGKEFRDDRVKWWRDGELHWMQSVVVPWRDQHGEIGGIHITAHDITEMIDAMNRTERSEARLRLALEMAEMHVFEMDFGRGLLEKAGAEETFYERPQTFEDMRTDSLAVVHPDDRERVGELLRQHVEEGAPYSTEYRINRADREVWAASVLKITRKDDGSLVRLTGAIQDITARKQDERELLRAKEDAEAANRAKSTFLATMSHEIRTPLNGVLGMAQAMAVGELCPVQRERLDVIRQSGETLLSILNDVLDLSKIEAGKLELEEAEFDLGDLAHGAHAAFTAIANKKGLSFDLKVEKAARGIYRGDSTRVRQVIYNLVSNALKFTERGEVRVKISYKRQRLNILVSDTGIGISKDRLSSLFQKFEQADASTTRRFGGTGLGLAICRELTTLMGGSIRAESEPGQGTTFIVSLPMPKVAASSRKRAPASRAPAATILEAQPLKVLAAEDNTVNQLVLKTLLHQIGVDPTIVENGAQAVAAWEREPWDLILMDVQMPETDGPTATRLIRERELASGRARTPIIALTANAMAHQVAEYRAAGMDGFVAKPIEIARLFAAMQEALPIECIEDAVAA